MPLAVVVFQDSRFLLRCLVAVERVVIVQSILLPAVGQVTQERIQVAILAAGAAQYEMADVLPGEVAGLGRGAGLRSQPHLAAVLRGHQTKSRGRKTRHSIEQLTYQW